MTRTHQTQRLGSHALVWYEGYNTYNPSARPSSRLDDRDVETFELIVEGVS